MVVKRQCSFCAEEIEPGTGMMFVKRDGTVFHFCSSSCRKQQLVLGRVGHRFKWTRAHSIKRAAEHASAARAPAAPAAPKPSAKARRTEPAATPPPPAAAPATPAPASPAEAAEKPAPKPRKPRTARPAKDASA